MTTHYHSRNWAPALATLAALTLGGCAADTGAEVETLAAALLEFPASDVDRARELSYGADTGVGTSASWGAIRWLGSADDEIAGRRRLPILV